MKTQNNNEGIEKEIIDYYYNPNLERTCEAIFDDTHRSYCKRRQRLVEEIRKSIEEWKKSEEFNQKLKGAEK